MQDRLDELAKKADSSPGMSDPASLVTWNALEDALEGVRDELEKPSSDTQGSSVELIRETSEAVSRSFFVCLGAKLLSPFTSQQSSGSVNGNSISHSSMIRLQERQAEGKRSLSGDSRAAPSDRLFELLQQLGTISQRHEQLHALVDELEVSAAVASRGLCRAQVRSFLAEKIESG